MQVKEEIAIIGAGIAGLSAAYELDKLIQAANLPYKICLYESKAEIGGNIKTTYLEDTLVELGPEAFITQNNKILDLIEELGLSSDLISMNPNHRRTFIYHQGKLKPLPDGFRLFAPTNFTSFYSSSLFSFKAKLRVLADLFLTPVPAEIDQSVADYVKRRFGQEVYDKVAEPMISSIYGGNVNKLSANFVLKLFRHQELKHGSVVRGLWKTAKSGIKESGPRYGLFMTLKYGLSSLCKALVKNLPTNSIQCNKSVNQITPCQNGYTIEFTDNSKVAVAGIICATPAYATSTMIKSWNPQLANKLNQIEYSSVIMINLIFDKLSIGRDITGFGYVVPSLEEKFLKACSFSSCKFPDRTASDKIWLRAFICGDIAKANLHKSEQDLLAQAQNELSEILDLKANPITGNVIKYPDSMPQYQVGHSKLIESINNDLNNYPNIKLCGNAYNGVGIPDCVANGTQSSQELIKVLNTAKLKC